MSFLSDLLEYYGITLKDLNARKAKGSFVLLERPDKDPGFQSVVHRLREAIAKKEKTVLYGDYDVDGLASTAILKIALNRLGLNPGFFIPSRYVEGYGLNAARVEQFVSKGYRLLVTLDNGVSASDAISLAKEKGMDVLVVDHHECPLVLPKADAIFHHKLHGFLPYNCSAASLSYFVASGLLGKDDPYLAFLAGIAVFSDVMPLVGNNLQFAKIALQEANGYRFPNIQNVLSFPLRYENLTFDLIPLLNAPGRICQDSLSTNWACQFLVRMEDAEFSAKKAEYLSKVNLERKRLVKKIQPQKAGLLETTGGMSFVYEGLSGLSGLIANRRMRESGKTVAAFCQDEKEPECYVGSLRSPFPILAEFLAENPNLFVRCGGHSKASGVTIRQKDYFRFATAFLSFCEKKRLDGLEEPTRRAIPISLSDLNDENRHLLESLEPFGEGFESPVFALTCATEEILKADGYFYAKAPDGKGKAIAFLSPSLLSDKETTTFYGRLRINSFRGRTTLELLADKIEQN